MFLIDDILLAPVRGLFWVFKEIRDAALEEQANEAEAITTKLSELYMMLETGQMTEAEFDAAEKALLDRLDAIKERAGREEEAIVVKRKRKKIAIPSNFKATGRIRHSRAGSLPDAIGDGKPGDVVAKTVKNKKGSIPDIRPG